MSATRPSFSHATIVHRDDRHRATLVSQLDRIGLHVHCLEPGEHLSDRTDIILFDAEHGEDDPFAWGQAFPPVPLVALVGSEAPGRIEWALERRATAFLRKPFGSSGAFTALLAAARLHAELARLREETAELVDRVRARPLVVRAVIEIMTRHHLDEAVSLATLRRIAMQRRLTIEGASVAIAAEPRLASSWLADAAPPALVHQTPRRNAARKDQV